MTVLVTGGAGFIGSVIVDELIRSGKKVVVVDNLLTGHREAIHRDAVFLEGDLLDKEFVEATFTQQRPKAVIHLAAKSLVGESAHRPMEYLGGNLRIALNVLEAMVTRGISQFVLSSTANLYSAPKKIPIDETETVIPGSSYGESKYLIERILQWLDQTKGLRFASLRYFNAAGATQERGEDHTPETHLIPLVLQIASGRRNELKIFGNDYPTPDGSCIRDYIHVEDLARAHLLALDAIESESKIYNLGIGKGTSVWEIISTAREVTKREIPITVVNRREGDVPILVADSRKARSELDWCPKYSEICQIIESTWRWYKKHPNGYYRDN